MFYDLNVPWTSAKDPELPRTLAFLAELGYDVVALNYTVSGKIPVDAAELTNIIPTPLPFPVPPKLTVLRRLTLPLTSQLHNARLRAISSGFDILALRPTDEKSFQNACSTLECDMISLDLSQRLSFHFKFKPLSEASRRGVGVELSYAAGLVGDANARRNNIGAATGLIRASRGRGLVVSSEAKRAGACRAPWDVINLLAVWGMKQEIAFEAVSKQSRSIVVQAGLKRSGWRGVVDIVDGGKEDDTKAAANGSEKAKANAKPGDGTPNGAKLDGNGTNKRKADAMAQSVPSDGNISKREQKRRAKKAREEANNAA